MSITLNANQLRAALDLCNPDGPEDKDQSEAEVTIIERDAFISSDGEQMPAGTYCYLTEYPEEGVVPLFDAQEKDDACGKCGAAWIYHDFGVPEPSCP